MGPLCVSGFLIDFYQKLCGSRCLYLLSPDLVVGAMSYISVLDCDICGWVVVSLLVRVGVYMCMCVRGKKGDLLVQALVLCQFGLVSDFWCVCVCLAAAAQVPWQRFSPCW